ncbi:putative BNR domain protein [Treponema primitia ZAS-2]|uniref:Putative BNR domain protein n=1 Tax=Treponema primitia (strain ATCC BAA-887 / DSM 12427 / ZAS-2) TaxID=545694 RepID=F5YKD1_TREPZ|nr:Ig-like domain-containing protein [Treponema primitia]AEF85400.1 putative BNR domain protein [Treponema primitia ZAS-2]
MCKKATDRSRILKFTLQSLFPICIFIILASPMWAHGKQENWQPVDGQEIWQKEYDISGLKRGKHNFLVRARDAAGNQTIDGPYNIVVDRNAGLPEVRIVYPEANAVIRQDTDFLGVASGRFGVDHVTVRLDDQASVQADGKEYWKFPISTFVRSVTLANGSTAERSLSEGLHVMHVKATDTRRTEGPEIQIPFIYDRTPPEVEFIGIETGQLVSGNIKLQGQASDTNGIATVEFSADGGRSFEFLDLKPNKKILGSFSFMVPFPTLKSRDGQVFFQLRATDTTGLISTKPYLLYVDNERPVIEVLSPADGDDSLGPTRVTGRIYDAVGLSKFYYEWVGETHDIEIRPGDPYWDINLNISYQNRNPTLRVYAVDKSNNQTVLVKRFSDSRKVKTPTLTIDYPTTGLNNLAADQSIIGHFNPGFIPATIIMEGRVEELPAEPGFRIPPDLIPQGRSTIRLWAKAVDGTVGSPYTLRVNKPASRDNAVPLDPKPSPIVISNYKAYDFIREGQISLRGRIAQQTYGASSGVLDASVLEELSAMTDISLAASLLESRDTEIDESAPDTPVVADEIPYSSLIAQGGAFRLEYRLNPQDDWGSVTIRGDGTFDLPVDMNSFREGPVHIELRTLQREVPAIPLYFPLNRAESDPVVHFISPVQNGTTVNGSTTVTGRVNSVVPIREIAFTTDETIFTPIEMKEGFQKYEFSTLFDFTAMDRAGGSFSIRVTDKNGDAFLTPLDVPVDAASDDPIITFNQPLEKEVIVDDLSITGIVQDDDQVYGIHWRIIKKDEDTTARTKMFAWEDEELEEESPLSSDFTFIETDQVFDISIPLAYLSDGEWIIEAFGEDIYGIQGEVTQRIIRVSLANPQVTMTDPVMTVYNRGVIYIHGNALDRNGIQGVWVSMDNGNSYQQAEGGEEWRLSLNTALYEDGEYAVLLRVRDRYDRETIDSAMLNIDNTPPDMVFEVPYDDADIGNTLDIAARIQDNIVLQEITLEVISVSNSDYRLTYTLDPAPVILEALDISEAPLGFYNIRIVATDMAGNTAVASRNVTKTTEAEASEASFYNPMPGEVHTGTINISGRTRGLVVPTEVQLWANREPHATVPVDKYGNFFYKFPQNKIPDDGFLVLSASYETPSGEMVFSNEHPMLYRDAGPTVTVESHKDGDVITGRPWLKGRAWMEFSPSQWASLPRGERPYYDVKKVLISFDNGRTYHVAKGTREWKFRLECSEIGRGPLPILIRAEFANGEIAIRRVVMTIDLDPPALRTLDPEEDTLHRDALYVYGTASEEYAFDSIMINLRPGDKALYMIPPIIQGLYLDASFFGATIASGGLGITFFENNVKLQVHAGIAPSEVEGEAGRYPGQVFGAKLIANLYNLPFRYIFGPDWEMFSMTWALGANFAYFSMGEGTPQILGAVLAQWEVARFTFPQFKVFSSYAAYVEPAVWFTSTEEGIKADRFKFRIGFGIRANVF